MKDIKHFSLKELVHPHVYHTYSRDRIINWIDLRVVRAWDWVRQERGNPIYMNTWGIDVPKWYPEMKDRGLRWHGKSSTGSQTSQHYFGRALDGDEVGTDNKELYEWLLDHRGVLLKYGVTTIEDIEYTPTWIHLDCRTWADDEFHIVKP